MISILFLLLSIVSSQNLKIYIFEVGQCDSQLILFPSGYSILIDVGENEEWKPKNGPYVAQRLQEILGKKYVDVLVLSHVHYDHHGGITNGGIWYLAEKEGFEFGKFISRDYGEYNGEKYEDCNKDNIDWKIIGSQEFTISAQVVCYTTSTKDKTKLSKIREVADICSTSQIHPPDENSEVQILMSDAKGISMKNGTRIDQDLRHMEVPPNENDYSICLRIQYGEFVYSSCGDLSGREGNNTSGSNTHDIETYVAPMMGEVDLYKANHHGSKTSSNQVWLDTLKPTVTVVSVGEINDSELPHPEPLERLKNVGSKVYITNNGKPEHTDGYDNITIFGDDIVITVPKDGRKFAVARNNGTDVTIYPIKLNKPKRENCRRLD